MGNYFFQWIAKKPLLMCECCGKNPAVGTHEYYAIPEYCQDCNDWRCDAFPGTHDQNGPYLKWHFRNNTVANFMNLFGHMVKDKNNG